MSHSGRTLARFRPILFDVRLDFFCKRYWCERFVQSGCDNSFVLSFKFGLLVLYEVRIESLAQISRRTNSKWFEFVRYGKGVGNLSSDY